MTNYTQGHKITANQQVTYSLVRLIAEGMWQANIYVNNEFIGYNIFSTKELEKLMDRPIQEDDTPELCKFVVKDYEVGPCTNFSDTINMGNTVLTINPQLIERLCAYDMFDKEPTDFEKDQFSRLTGKKVR